MNDSLKPATGSAQLLPYPELMTAILEQIPVRVFWKDAELRYLGCNTLFARDAGFTAAEEVIGKDDFQMAWRDHAGAYRADDLKVMSSGQPKLDYEVPQTSADGRKIWLRTSKMPLRDGDGKIIGLLGLYEDVTRRKSSEDALRKSEHDLREAQRIAETGSWHLDLLSGKVQWTHEMYQMFDLDPSRPPPDLPIFSKLLTADSWTLMNGAFSALVNEGKPYEIELETVGKNDRGNWILSRGEAVRDANDKIIGVRGVSANITRRKQAEEALLRSRDLLSKIVETIPIRVFWKDTELRYLGCNSAFASDAGLPNPANIVGKTDFELSWQEQAELYRSDDKQVMESGVPKLAYEEPQRGPGGETLWLRTSKVPLRDVRSRVIGMLGIYEDITADKQAELALHNANRALHAISACNEAMFRSRTEEELLNAVCTLIVEIGDYQLAWIGYAQDDDTKSVKPMVRHGADEAYLDGQQFSRDEHLPVGRGPVGNAIRTGVPQVIRNFLLNPTMTPWQEAAHRHGFHSVIALPLASKNRVFGVLVLYALESDTFGDQEVALLTDLSKDLAYGIESLRTRAERDRIAEENQRQLLLQQQNMKDFIRAIAGTVEMRDPYTAGHQYRASQLAVAIAREMGMNEFAVNGIELAAMVHDVGQINIPAEILCRPGTLSEHEYLLIKQHPQTGYDTLKDIQFPWPIATIILQHHERLDGSGYPQGLKGDEILMESRIMAVADVVEAMSSHRPYRPARDIDTVIAELEKGRGSRYDQTVVDACLRLLRDKKFSFRH